MPSALGVCFSLLLLLPLFPRPCGPVRGTSPGNAIGLLAVKWAVTCWVSGCITQECRGASSLGSWGSIDPAVIAASTAAPPSQVTQHRPMFTPISSACSGNPRCTAAAARLALRAVLRNAAAPRMATVRAKGYGMSQRLRNEPKATE